LAKVSFKIEGLRELGKAFQDLSGEVQLRAARAAVGAGIRVIQQRAQDNAPERTGLLVKSITVRRSKKASYPGVEWWSTGVFTFKRKYANTTRNRQKSRVDKEYEGDDEAYYWRFLEFGTVKMAKHPFLGPAFNTEAGQGSDSMAVRKLSEVLKKRIEAFVKKQAKKPWGAL